MGSSLCPNVRRVWSALLGLEQGLLAPVRSALKARGVSSVEEAEALLALKDAPEHKLRPFALERALRRPQYTTSRVVDRLVQDERAVRETCPSDLRGHDVRLTDTGLSAAEAVLEVYTELLMQAIGGRLGVERVPEIASALERLVPAEG